MSTTKIIVIIILLLIGFHLLLYGYVRRRINAAKHFQQNDSEPRSENDQNH